MSNLLTIMIESGTLGCTEVNTFSENQSKSVQLFSFSNFDYPWSKNMFWWLINLDQSNWPKKVVADVCVCYWLDQVVQHLNVI